MALIFGIIFHHIILDLAMMLKVSSILCLGFYAFYREAFEKVKIEEEKAFNNKQLDSEEEDSNTEFEKLPGFGTSTTPIEFILKFYLKWENFVTYK